MSGATPLFITQPKITKRNQSFRMPKASLPKSGKLQLKLKVKKVGAGLGPLPLVSGS